ncbi:MAG TPA: GNAT family N-acetyltransferase [Candidatus Limnocylindrales bacterium]|jgi:GNAT superfamily N-acetyltransferase
MDDGALIEAAVTNTVAAYEAVARYATWPVSGGSRRFGKAIAVASGHPTIGFWNAVVAGVPGTDPDDVLAAHAWIDGLGLPVSVHVGPTEPEGSLDEALEARGLRREPWTAPVMALTPIPSAAAHPELRVEMVDAGSYGSWLRAFAGSDEATERAGHTFGPGIALDPDLQLISGYIGDRLVATSFAVRSGPVVGIYGVHTDEGFRRRGIGTAITREAIGAGARWGCVAAILQASEMGLPVYEAMGFRRIADMVSYEAPRRPIG